MSEMKSPAYQTTEVSSTSVTAKYPCDFVCKCPASNSVEKAEQDLLAKLRDEVEGLDRYYSGNEGLLFLDATGHVVLFADVLALIADIEKGGE